MRDDTKSKKCTCAYVLYSFAYWRTCSHSRPFSIKGDILVSWQWEGKVMHVDRNIQEEFNLLLHTFVNWIISKQHASFRSLSKWVAVETSVSGLWPAVFQYFSTVWQLQQWRHKRANMLVTFVKVFTHQIHAAFLLYASSDKSSFSGTILWTAIHQTNCVFLQSLLDKCTYLAFH